jgi:hypothetical protein
MLNLGAVGSPSNPLHHSDRLRNERKAIPNGAGLIPRPIHRRPIGAVIAPRKPALHAVSNHLTKDNVLLFVLDD